MAEALQFHFNGQEIKTYFNHPRAQVSVSLRNGTHRLLPWGRRQTEASNLPMGGWARLEAIQAGEWDAFFPQPVKIPAVNFMEKDIEQRPHWFPVTRGRWIQGVLAKYDQEQRIYIVTVTPIKHDAIFLRWPRLV